MPFDLDKFLKELKEAGSLSDEQVQTLQATLGNEATQSYLEKTILRQSDYSRKMNDLSAKETQYNQAISQSEQLSQLYEDLKKHPEISSADLAKARQELADVRAKAATLYNSLYEYDQGKDAFKAIGWNDVNSIFGGQAPSNLNPQSPTQPVQPAFDEAALMKKIRDSLMGEINGNFQSVAEFSIDNQEMLLKLNSLGIKTSPSALKKTLGAKMAELKTNNYWDAFNAAFDIPKLEKEQEFSSRLESEKAKWKEQHQVELQRSLANGNQAADESSEIFRLLREDGNGDNSKANDPPQAPPTPSPFQTSSDEYAQAASALSEVRGK